MSYFNPTLRERAERIAYTSVDDARQTVRTMTDMDVLTIARDLAARSKGKTKVALIERRIRKLQKADAAAESLECRAPHTMPARLP